MDGVACFCGVSLSHKIDKNKPSLQLMAFVLHATWRRRPADLERGCGYIEQGVADKRQGMVFQVRGWSEGLTHLTVRTLTYS